MSSLKWCVDVCNIVLCCDAISAAHLCGLFKEHFFCFPCFRLMFNRSHFKLSNMNTWTGLQHPPCPGGMCPSLHSSLWRQPRSRFRGYTHDLRETQPPIPFRLKHVWNEKKMTWSLLRSHTSFPCALHNTTWSYFYTTTLLLFSLTRCMC